VARILVTGASGFIGSRLVEYLLDRGDEVLGLVPASDHVRSLVPLLESCGHRLQLVTGDLRDRATLDYALDGLEFVYHLGAVIAGTSEKEFRDTNVAGTRNLLEAMVSRCSSRFRRFLFTSSQAAVGPSPDGNPIDETHPPHPVSLYGRSKRDAEAVVMEFSDRLPVTIVRPAKVYGEREQGISRALVRMVRAGLAPRLGLRSRKVSLVYVGDVIEGMVAAAESPHSLGKSYFLSDPRPYDQSEVIGAIADSLGKRPRFPVVVPHPFLWIIAVLAEWTQPFTGRRPLLTRDKVRELRPRWWTVTPGAAETDFGWRSPGNLSDGIARAVVEFEAADRRWSRTRR
jgi:nucleoside-diphosphate-sugar epimerase